MKSVKKSTEKELLKKRISQVQKSIKNHENEIELLHARINYLEEVIIEMKKNQVAIELSKLLQ